MTKTLSLRLITAALALINFAVSMPVEAQTRQAIIRYDSVHHPVVGLHGMVVSQNDLASDIGRDILAQGGNAVDAAVAMGLSLIHI